MPPTRKKITFSMSFIVVSIFIFASVFTASIAIGLQYYFSRSLAHASAIQLYDFRAQSVSSDLKQQNDNASNTSSRLANLKNLVRQQDLHPDALKILTDVMNKNNLYHSIYVGFPNGDLQQLVNISEQQNIRKQLQAKPGDRWLLISITGEGEQRYRHYFYLDEFFNLRSQRKEKTHYDATNRVWFSHAQALHVNKSDAYVFSAFNSWGQTYSIKVPDSELVLGLDITFDALSERFKKYNFNDDGDSSIEVYLYQRDGNLLASNQENIALEKDKNNLETAPLKLLLMPSELLTALSQYTENDSKLQKKSIDGEDYYIHVSAVGKIQGTASFLAIIVPDQTLFAKSMLRVKTFILITILCVIILLPLALFFSLPIIRPIKALSMEAKKIKSRHYEQLKPITSRILEIQELNDSVIDMSEAIQTHQASQKELMESFIKLIAQAIDEKSPSTANHCNRVPELSLMIAAAAEKSELPAFKDFKFNNADERHEFRIAAWLHDCGKITTPECIVNKGTKLESIYNRIHEIRMRFEVLWRDAEITYYQQSLLYPLQNKPLKEALIKQQLQLMRDFEFVAKSNIGSESMEDKDINRLQQISQQSWLRYFDDRLGLSPDEERRLQGKKQKLPVKEMLLSNKIEHIIPRDVPIIFNPKFGIKIHVPEHLYNLGEMYNLSITHGTLTSEDRFKINQHVISTISMLESLPFPPELMKVPRYASTHHETLNGTGYPRKLSAQDLSIPERILIIADIFEALTSADRHYKKAQPISVAIDILYYMALDHKVDMDIFKLFLSSGIYLQYAHQFLDQEQINEVNIGQYL